MIYDRVELQAICNINMGQSPDSCRYNQENDGIPFFQGNSDFGDMYPVTRMWCSKPTKIANAGDLLLSVRAPIGALNFATEKCCIGRGLAAISPVNEKVNIKYIYYALKSKHQELNNKGTGSTFKAINKGSLSEVKIPNIEITEQNNCVEKLDRVGKVIKHRKTQLDELDNLIKSRFVEMFGDENNPMNWNYVLIDEVAEVQVGVVIKPAQYYTDKKNGNKAFRSLNVGELKIKDNDWVYFNNEGNKINSRSILKENDILIVRSGAPGTACVVTKEFEGSNAIDVIIARANENLVNPYYLAAYTNFPHGKNQIIEGTGGAAQQHFNVGRYKTMRLMLPPIELQNKYNAFIKQVDKLKVEVQKSLDKTQVLFDSLMQQYFE